MMSRYSGFFLKATAACVLVGLLGLPVPADEENPLNIQASISPQRLSRGQEGKVLLRITTDRGIIIIPQPSLTIEFDPSEELVFPKNFFTASDLEIEVLKEEGRECLNLSNAIEIPFTVSMEAPSGSHQLEGKVKYFAFSRSEGWCLKKTVKFQAAFSTRSTVYRKR